MQNSFPPQTGEYRVDVKSGQSTDAWSDFERARCQISVGQDYHTGAKLKAMIDWSANRFKKGVQICVNDTLQRFNMMFEQGISEDKARDNALEKGHDWVSDHRWMWDDYPHIKEVQWDEWLNDDAYQKARLQIDFLYSANQQFAQAINHNIMDIWNRRKSASPTFYTPERFDRFFDLSRQYLLEEITVFSIMFDRQEAIDIYPGTTIFAATVFQGQSIANAPAGLGKGHFCRIDFKHNKSYQPAPDTRQAHPIPYAQRDVG